MINILAVFLLLISPVDHDLQPAVRLNNAYQETPLPPPPVVEPLLNPERLTGCDEMEWYRKYVGLPEVFDGLGWRESNCRNDVRTYCCYGYWQVYISLWLSPKSSYRNALIDSCGISGVASIYGLSNQQKLAQACAVKVAYNNSGLSPWRL